MEMIWFNIHCILHQESFLSFLTWDCHCQNQYCGFFGKYVDMFDRKESQFLLFFVNNGNHDHWNNSDYKSTYEVYMFKDMLVWVNVLFLNKFGQLTFFPKCVMCFFGFLAARFQLKYIYIYIYIGFLYWVLTWSQKYEGF